MVDSLAAIFPGLARATYRVTSPRSKKYNCVAWAAGHTENWWWPEPEATIEYWPPTAPRLKTVDAFRQAFAFLGYEICDTAQLEPGFEKVAVFADENGVPQHAARQLTDGRWTSKLGQAEDIEHGLEDLTGAVYGSVVLILKRPAAQ